MRRRIAFLAAALVAGLGVAVYRNRKMEAGEARLQAQRARTDGAPATKPKPESAAP